MSIYTDGGVIDGRDQPDTGKTLQTGVSYNSGQTFWTGGGHDMVMQLPNPPMSTGSVMMDGAGSPTVSVGSKVGFWNDPPGTNGEYMIVTVGSIMDDGSNGNWSWDYTDITFYGGMTSNDYLDSFDFETNPNNGAWIDVKETVINVDTDMTSTISVDDYITIPGTPQRYKVTAIDSSSITVGADLAPFSLPNGTPIYKQAIFPLISKAEPGNPSNVIELLKWDPVINSIIDIDALKGSGTEAYWLRGEINTTYKIYELIVETDYGHSYNPGAGLNNIYHVHAALVKGDIVVWANFQEYLPRFAYRVEDAKEGTIWGQEMPRSIGQLNTTLNGDPSTRSQTCQMYGAETGMTQSHMRKVVVGGSGPMYEDYHLLEVWRKNVNYPS